MLSLASSFIHVTNYELTSLLKDKQHQALRDKFKTEFPRPDFKIKREILAEPLTNNYGIIGAAFDYLLRFYIQQKNKKYYDDDSWLAESGYSGLKFEFSSDGKKLSELEKRFLLSQKRHKQFLKNGNLTNEFLADILFLAKLDLYIRSRMIAPDLFTESDLDVQDLRNLYNSIDSSSFVASDICYLNPFFGKGSTLVGGADADIILDDTLIDIKVTKHLKLDRDYLNQIIGYYILALIGGISDVCDGAIIKNVGIYFARHGFLWKIPISHFGNSDKINDFKNWFIKYLSDLKEERKLIRKQAIRGKT